MWDEGTTGRHMHSCNPHINSISKIRRRNRREEVILTRLRMGHCGLNAYKSIIDKDVSEFCDNCTLHVVESVQQFLLECPAHTNCRHSLRGVVFEKDSTFTLNSILGPNLMYGSIQRAVLNFVIESGKYGTL